MFRHALHGMIKKTELAELKTKANEKKTRGLALYVEMDVLRVTVSFFLIFFLEPGFRPSHGDGDGFETVDF